MTKYILGAIIGFSLCLIIDFAFYKSDMVKKPIAIKCFEKGILYGYEYPYSFNGRKFTLGNVVQDKYRIDLTFYSDEN